MTTSPHSEIESIEGMSSTMKDAGKKVSQYVESFVGAVITFHRDCASGNVEEARVCFQDSKLILGQINEWVNIADLTVDTMAFVLRDVEHVKHQLSEVRSAHQAENGQGSPSEGPTEGSGETNGDVTGSPTLKIAGHDGERDS